MNQQEFEKEKKEILDKIYENLSSQKDGTIKHMDEILFSKYIHLLKKYYDNVGWKDKCFVVKEHHFGGLSSEKFVTSYIRILDFTTYTAGDFFIAKIEKIMKFLLMIHMI